MFGRDSNFDDVFTNSYDAAQISVNTTEVLAEVDSNTDRQAVRITNTGNNIIYIGPQNKTYIPLYPRQWIFIPVTRNISVYMKCNAGSSTAVVEEYN